MKGSTLITAWRELRRLSWPWRGFANVIVYAGSDPSWRYSFHVWLSWTSWLVGVWWIAGSQRDQMREFAIRLGPLQFLWLKDKP